MSPSLFSKTIMINVVNERSRSMNAVERAPFQFEVEDVYLSSGFSGKIVSCTEGGALAANVDRASTWETIVPEPQPDGTVAFRSKFSNLYISVVDGAGRLVPSVPWIREWGKFQAFRCDFEARFFTPRPKTF